MKRLSAILLAQLLALGLPACGTGRRPWGRRPLEGCCCECWRTRRRNPLFGI